MKPLLFLLTLFAFFFAAFILQAQQTGNLEGRITDTAGNLLPGARIYAVGTTKGALSKVNGSFVIAGLRAGTYTIKVSCIGMFVVEREAVIEPGKTTTLNLSLHRDTTRNDTIIIGPPRKRYSEIGSISRSDSAILHAITSMVNSDIGTGSIGGRVFDKDGQAIPGTRIEVVGTDRGAIAGSDGSFSITGLSPEIYTLRFAFIGRKTVEMNVRVNTGATTSVEVILQDDPDAGNWGCPDMGRTPSLIKIDPLTTGTTAILSRDDILRH